MKKLLLIFTTALLFLIIIVGGYAYYLTFKANESINDVKTDTVESPPVSTAKKYVNYVSGIIGELDKRYTISANIAYDYQDGKLTKEEALEQIGENVLYTRNAHDTYVPFDISSLTSTNQIIAKRIEITTEKLLDLYFETQLYIQNAVDDGVYLDPWEFPATIGMDITDLIGEHNNYVDQLLDR